ncbi:hypothetical protein V2O64_10630 [Verrucomicrobiaceae bacterium 227]
MESYHARIAGNPAVELIHVSQDHDVGQAEKWAREARFPWPTLIQKEIPAEITKYSPKGSVPDYVLVNAAGEVVANGKEAAFEKIKSHSSE